MSSQHLLRVHSPEIDTDSTDTFRCDNATIAQVLDWWQQNPSRKIHSHVAETERKRIWAICRAFMGSQLCDDARPFHLLAFINQQPGVKKENTKRRWNATIQHPFNEAELLRIITKNPFRGVKFEEGDEGRDWTDEEFLQIIQSANEPFGELILGLRLSGLRPGEGCALQWPHVRFQAGDIRFRDHKTRHVTKNDRCIPLNDPLIKLLHQIKARNHPGGHVFRNTRKRPWIRSHADSNFRRLRERLGLPDDVKLHGCRHTFGTQAILSGVAVAIVAQLLGHTDYNTTKKYVHLANKVDHLAASSNQAVASVPIVGARQIEPHETPLFDGLE